MSIGARIKKLRNDKNMSQRGLSRLAGVSQPTISDYESETIIEHRAHILIKIATALGTTPEYLITGKGEQDLNNVRYLKSEMMAVLDQMTPEAQAAILIAAKAMIQR